MMLLAVAEQVVVNNWPTPDPATASNANNMLSAAKWQDVLTCLAVLISSLAAMFFYMQVRMQQLDSPDPKWRDVVRAL